MKKITYLILAILLACSQILMGQTKLRDSVWVKKEIFSVIYSEVYQQPLWITYKSTNRPTLVKRGSMDFYTEKEIKTSDGDDYVKNVYDKGHLAPAATFSDNLQNLKATFTYLNSALQNQYLNRGEWRLLEEQERKWDDNENLQIIIVLNFDKNSENLPTGAKVPMNFKKHIFFEKQKTWKCFYFLNERPNFKWQESERSCSPNEHKNLFLGK